MRARNLKPGFFKNELLGSSDALHGLLFAGLWCMADREGRLEDRPLRLCGELFPYRRAVTAKKMDKMLGWLEANDFIRRYEAAGARYIQIVNFGEHQSPHRDERASRIPAPESTDAPAHESQDADFEEAPSMHRGSTVEAPCKHGASTMQAPEEHGANIPSSLTPDSGLLNPDSGYLSEEARARGEQGASTVPGNGKAPGSNGAGAGVGTVLTHAQVKQIKAVYPAGRYKPARWADGEHCLQEHAARGVPFGVLLAGAQRYRDCWKAEGGEERSVYGPQEFFSLSSPMFERPWVPSTGAPKTNGNGRPKFIPAPDPDEIERMTAQGKTWTPDNGWTPA